MWGFNVYNENSKNIFEKEVSWVAIEIINIEWKILYIIEWNTKSWKKENQISLPMWTIENWEQPMDTLIRELKEEVLIDVLKEGIDINEIKEVWDFVMYVDRIKINIKKYQLILEKNIDYWNPESDEIKDVFWEDKDFLKEKNISNIRPWVFEILEKNNVDNCQIVFIKDWEYIIKK